MGNCCKPVKTTQHSQHSWIDIQVFGSTSKVPYQRDKPVAALFEQLELTQADYTLFKGSSEILDFTATLRQLGITPLDKLSIQPKDSPSLDIIADEENAVPDEIGTIQARFVATVTRVGARTMWHTAHSPTNNRQQAAPVSDMSSVVTHTLDFSMKEREPPNLPFQIACPFVESEDSAYT